MNHKHNNNAPLLNTTRFSCSPLGAGMFAFALGTMLMFAPHAAHADTVFQDTFEMDATGWMGYGPHARLGTTNEASKVKSGKGALAFNYRIENGGGAADPGQPPIDALVRVVPDGQLAKARALSFWARTDANTPLALTLTEKNGGGRYMAVVWLPKNQWQHVVVTTEDFYLTDGKDDPKDPNGKLDMDQIESVTLLNLYSYLALSVKDTPGNATLFPAQTGEHSLWLDDFSALTVPPAADRPEPILPEEKSGIWLEALRRDAPAWFPLGNLDMQLDAKSPIKGRALRLDYTQEKGKIAAIVHDLHNVNMSRCDQLQFDIASTHATKVVLVLEEKSGAKYNAIVDVAGDGVSAHKAVYFANFTLSDDSPKDPNGKLDLDQLKNLTIVDIASFTAEQSQPNTLWLGPLRASLGK